MKKQIKKLGVVMLSSTMALTSLFAPASIHFAQETPKTYESETLTEKPRLEDDFYTHLNYDYLKETTLPEGLPSTGNMTELALQAKEDMQTILAELNDQYSELTENSEEKKVVDFYNLAVDFDKRDELGLSPIQPTLDTLRAADSIQALNQFMLDNLKKNYAPFLTIGVSQDIRDSTNNILYVVPAVYGLEQDYYTGTDEASTQIRDAYKKFTQDIFMIAGYSEADAAKKSEAVFDFEAKLAETGLTKEEQSDQSIQYHVMTLEEVEKLTSNLPIGEAIKANGLDKASKIVVREPKSTQMLNSLYVEENLEAIKAYTEFSIIRRNALNLSKDLIEAVTEYSAIYTGVTHLEADDELAFQLTEGTFGELLGKFYAERKFSPETKEAVIEMTNKIIKRYEERITEVDWLSEPTKALAKKKLETLVVKIGYPDKWKDFSSIEVKPYDEGGNLIQTLEAAKIKETEDNFASLNQAPDKTKWELNPQTVNAYYNPIGNEIVFTAAILQNPFYDPERSLEENLGGIGAIIGHEISHAFDNSGAQFDENGNLNNWWTEEDFAKFNEKVKKAADIYSALEVVDGHHVNGAISTGEIMADLGGLTVVVDIAKREGLDTKKVFESYASVWRGVSTKESLIADLTDEHPPGKFRVNNIVNLLDQFYEDFNITENDKMYVKPEERLKVW